MGYSTDFKGCFRFQKEVSQEMEDYINRFAATRHCQMDMDYIRQNMPEDIVKYSFFGDAGKDGQFIATEKYEDEPQFLQNKANGEPSPYKDYNETPDGIPGLWCQWVIEDDASGEKVLCWDGGEKFYNYVRWLKYLIGNFFAPQGYILNGKVIWQGEDIDDRGKIEVINNVVKTTELE